MTRTPLATAIGSIFAVSAFAVPQLALGQVDEELDIKEEVLEEVVTTGSRIKKDAFTTSTPVDIVDIGTASIQGIANIGQLLQTATIAAGSPQVTAATSAQFVQSGGLGAQTISLRGLGANRTLTLINGRRAGPAGIKGAVSSFDLNTLPLSTIERVEVLKDGASSIYGSDAVAGVVNIITRKDDGVTIDGFVSTPTESGGEETRLSVSYGKSFDRANFRVTADYNERKELRRGDRDYFTCGNQYIFDQDTGQRADVIDPRTGDRWCEDLTWGHVWIYDYAADTNNPGGQLSQYDYDNDLAGVIPGYAVDPTNASYITQPGGFFPVGYDRLTDGVTNDNHPFQDKESLNPEVELMTLYGEGEFDITDNLTAYTEVLLNRRETAQDSYRQYWSYIYSGDYDFGSLGGGVPGGGNPLSADAGWFGEQWYSPTAITDHNDARNEIDYTRLVLGMRGALTDNWDWDVSYMYSKSDASYTEQLIYDDSIRDQNWLAGSCAGAPTSVRGVPCVDVPWLDPELLRGNVSPQVADFLFGEETGNTEYTQSSIDAYVTGDVWELPAGPIATAAGIHYRKDDLNDTPGPVTLAGNSWFGDFAGITAGDDTTVAVYAEFDIPLIVDQPGFENLTLNASARYTDVDSFGDDTTWKVGLNWQVVDSIRLRANKATSFRAPALFELYLADQTSSISQRSDPCIRYEEEFTQNASISETTYLNCQADPANLAPDYTGGTITPTVFTGGGAGVLKAETSDSLTAGIIWQPQFADLSISFDYFEFEVLDQVDQLGGARIVANCYESEFGFAFGNTEPLCALFDRSGVNDGIDNVRDSFINVARQTNKGYDVAIRYNGDLGPGSFNFDVKATRQLEDTQALFEETATDFNGRVGDPKWVGETNLTYYWNDFSFYWGMNVIGRSDSTEIRGATVQYRGQTYDAVRYTENAVYHSFSGSYEMDNGLRLLAGVANAFDQNPPQLTRIGTGNEYSMIGNSMLKSNYDMLGKRVFFNATWNFE